MGNVATKQLPVMKLRSGFSTPTHKFRSTLSKFAYKPNTNTPPNKSPKPGKLPRGNTKAGLRAHFRVLAEGYAQQQPRLSPACVHPTWDQLMYLTGGVNDGRFYRVVRILFGCVPPAY